MSSIEEGMMSYIFESLDSKTGNPWHGSSKQTCLVMKPVVVRRVTISGLTKPKNIIDIAFFG